MRVKFTVFFSKTGETGDMNGLLRSWLNIRIQTQKIIPKAVTSIGVPKEARTPRFLNIFGVF